jgi:phage baseplate assembly protein V
MVSDRSLASMLGPITRRLGMVAARAIVRWVDDSATRQRLQVEILKDELRDDVERLQNYGLSSRPHEGAEAVVLSPSGRREQSIVIVVDDRRYRLTGLKAGEVALYDDIGNRVLLLRDRLRLESKQRVEVDSPEVAIKADRTTIESDLDVKGKTTFTGSVTANGTAIDDTHMHDKVQPGNGISGTPT